MINEINAVPHEQVNKCIKRVTDDHFSCSQFFFLFDKYIKAAGKECIQKSDYCSEKKSNQKETYNLFIQRSLEDAGTLDYVAHNVGKDQAYSHKRNEPSDKICVIPVEGNREEGVYNYKHPPTYCLKNPVTGYSVQESWH